MHGFSDIAITGASGGLGRALAVGYATPGVRLHLTGRDAARLAATAGSCRARGATVTETIADVTDQAAVAAWIESCLRLDLVIANAGISAGPGRDGLEKPEMLRAVLATNIGGSFNTILPALALMKSQAPGANGLRGRIAVIGSIAGLIALPTAPAYSAAKAALDRWVTASAPNAAKAGIGLTIVRPGFIRTPMTAKNPFKMPGLMEADAAAARIIAGLAAGRTHITFPAAFAAFARLGQMLPKSLMARLPDKPAQ